MFTLALHDASTGFHDIKAIYDFPAPSSFAFSMFCLFAAVIGAVSVFVQRRRLIRKKSTSSLSLEEEMLQALGKLESKRRRKQVSLRNYAAELSRLFRKFLQRSLNIPANELTRQELELVLAEQLQKTLPRVASEHREQFQSFARSLLGLCELIICSRDSEQLYPLEKDLFDIHAEQFEHFVQEIEANLRREAQRTQSVIEANKSRNRWGHIVKHGNKESSHAI